MQLGKSLTESLKSKRLEERASEPKSDNVLAEKANISGELSLILSFSMKLKSGSIWAYLLTMIGKNKFDMGPHLWVLDLLVIAHPAHPLAPPSSK